jgi:hypothetical protein
VGLLIVSAGGNANSQAPDKVGTEQGQKKGDVDRPFILGRLYNGQDKTVEGSITTEYLSPAALARDQTLHVDLTNRLESNRKKDNPPRIYAVVKLYDEKSQVIARSDKVNLPFNQSHSITFNRAAIRLSGDSGTERIEIRVGVEVHSPDSNVVYVSSGSSGVWASLKVIDNITGETTSDTQKHPFILRNVNSYSKPGSGKDLTSNSKRPDPSDRTTNLSAPQLEFLGKEAFEADGTTGTRYKLAVTNRTSYPQSLWHASANLPPCGKNENASRTSVEIFGSPGDKRLGVFCAVGSSEDLGQLWFAVPAGVKGPPCVYMVMTDRQSGQKYESERLCSRSFTVVTGRLKE